nr:polysaccharide pyruvyl transferase family protein [uncultured Bacteroides sp.]
MKIGVITYWFGNSNYGMMMQCWALQRFLKDLGHEPYVIRFAKKDNQRLYRKILSYFGLLQFFDKVKCQCNHEKFVSTVKNNRIRKFDDFRKGELSFSQYEYSSIDELQTLPPKADCYITGSDQVWSQLLDNNDNTAYYLNFGDRTTKRIAYAPSFSMKEYPEHLCGKLSKMLQNLDYISVREYDGIKICSNLGFVATKVLDPTLLLDKQHYLDICVNVKRRTDNYVFVYSLNVSTPEDIRWEELSEYKRKTNKELIVTPADGYFTGGEIFGSDVNYLYATVEQWLALIRDSDLTVTSSFHGIVLSIIFERPFIYVPLKGKFASGNNRIIDLLKELRLENRILTDKTSYDELCQLSIDWNTTGDYLKKYKFDSIAFLKSALEGKM